MRFVKAPPPPPPRPPTDHLEFNAVLPSDKPLQTETRETRSGRQTGNLVGDHTRLVSTV